MNQYLAQLDQSLARRGEDVVVRRTVLVGGEEIRVSIACRARIRGNQRAELVGDIVQGDSAVILSPSPFLVAQTEWAAAVGDELYPIQGDRVMVRGQAKIITAAEVTMQAGSPVRIDLSVRG